MFELATFSDIVRVPPEFLGDETKEAVLKSLAEKYENKIIKDIGVILVVKDVVEIGPGKIKAEDPGVYYPVKFKAMIYNPKLHEVVNGTVVDITDFGVFVRFGPIDGLCHISQIINDYITYDKKASVLMAKESKRILKEGDDVRARIIGVSLEKKEINKINLTMRQPGLGAHSWLEEERKAKKKEAKKGKK